MIVSGHSAEGLGLRRPLDGPAAPSTRSLCSAVQPETQETCIQNRSPPVRVSPCKRVVSVRTVSHLLVLGHISSLHYFGFKKQC